MFQLWGTPGSLTNYYQYTYDKLNRLLSGFSTANNNESLAYDVMGNITALNRYTSNTLTDQLSYSYSSTNQVQSIVDATSSNTGLVAGTTSYTYDGNGNMLTQTNSTNTAQNKTLTYNLSNLPQTIAVANGTVTYTYNALGTKMRKVSVISGTTKTTDYIEGIEYDGGTTDTLNFITTEEGKAAKFGSIYDYQYFLGDNLGNTRVTFGTKTGSAVTYQKDDYYPFGMEIVQTAGNPKNEYLYNKKELQEETQEYDYGARFYDPVIGRFTTEDKLSDKFPWYSQYQFAGNEVPNAFDRDGLEPAYPDHDRMVVARDGGMNKGTSNPQAIAYSKQQTRTTVEGAKLGPVSQVVSDVLVPIGNAVNTLRGQNPDRSTATVSQKIGAIGQIFTSLPMKGAEGGEGGVGGDIIPAPKLPDNATVVRGGVATPEQILNGTGTHPTTGDKGFSVECGTCSVKELAAPLKNNQVGVTTVGEVRNAGGDVVKTPGNSPNHATVTGLTPTDASKILTPPIKNPAKD